MLMNIHSRQDIIYVSVFVSVRVSIRPNVAGRVSNTPSVAVVECQY